MQLRIMQQGATGTPGIAVGPDGRSEVRAEIVTTQAEGTHWLPRRPRHVPHPLDATEVAHAGANRLALARNSGRHPDHKTNNLTDKQRDARDTPRNDGTHDEGRRGTQQARGGSRIGGNSDARGDGGARGGGHGPLRSGGRGRRAGGTG